MLPVVQVESGVGTDHGRVVPLVADPELVATDERNHDLVGVRPEVHHESHCDPRVVGMAEPPQFVPGPLADALEKGRVVGGGMWSSRARVWSRALMRSRRSTARSRAAAEADGSFATALIDRYHRLKLSAATTFTTTTTRPPR